MTKCPDCGKENPGINASHHYSIDYSEEQGKYVKGEGQVRYSCAECNTELDITDIEDALTQVDEL